MSSKKRELPYIIAVDFDGTLCESEYPFIKSPNVELINWLKEEQRKGSRIILWTCRVGKQLRYALEWCAEQGIDFDAINDNIPEYYDYYHDNPRKIYAHLYIDDKSIDSVNWKLPYKEEKKNESPD